MPCSLFRSGVANGSAAAASYGHTSPFLENSDDLRLKEEDRLNFQRAPTEKSPSHQRIGLLKKDR